MAGKSTGRKAKPNQKSLIDEIDNVSLFKLPHSLPCSEIDFPILIPRKNTASWAEILQESGRTAEDIKKYIDSKAQPKPKSPFLKTESDYIKNEVFPYLLPALEESLNKAELWGALKTQKCFFNGIDHIAQVLWNKNPRYPYRKDCNFHLFNMPWVREHLRQHPRNHYPKSWLWTEEYAATVIQKTLRQYFVQRDAEVQEMREFWEKLEIERRKPELSSNPLFAKKFASGSLVKDK